MRALGLTISCLLLALATSGAQLRKFEDPYGRSIEAKLISHGGVSKEKVTMAKADGREFQAKISSFSADDQAYIREWMKQTPATIDYSFRIEAQKKPGDRKGRDYYVVTVTNLSHDTVSDLKVTTRTFCTNERPLTTDPWFHYGGEVYAKEESFDVKGEVRFNRTARLVATEQYRIFGIFVQIHDTAGKLIAEEKIGTPKATKLDWDSGKKYDERSGGKTTVTIE